MTSHQELPLCIENAEAEVCAVEIVAVRRRGDNKPQDCYVDREINNERNIYSNSLPK